MSGRNTPEYQAVSRNRQNLERHMNTCVKDVAAKLRDNNTLTLEQHDAIVASSKSSSDLVRDVLLAMEYDPVEVFVEFVDVLKTCGNRIFNKFVENDIESMRKQKYRDLLTHSGESGPPYDVFISYGREPETNTVVNQISDRLKGANLKVFVDRNNINPGDVWPATLVNAINSCKVFVAVLTKKYVRSLYCNGELFEAEALRKALFPIQYEADWDQGAAGIPIKKVVQSYQFTILQRGEQISDQFVQSVMAKCGVQPSSNTESSSSASSGAGGPPRRKDVQQPSQPATTGCGGPVRRRDQGGSTGLSLQDLKDNIPGLTDGHLTTDVEPRDISKIAECFGAVQDAYLTQLGLVSTGDIQDIKDTSFREGHTAGMAKALTLWQGRNPFKAKFLTLVNILLDLQKGTEAVKLCKYLMSLF